MWYEAQERPAIETSELVGSHLPRQTVGGLEPSATTYLKSRKPHCYATASTGFVDRLKLQLRLKLAGMGGIAEPLRSQEKIPVELFQDSSFASSYVAHEIANLVKETGRKGWARHSRSSDTLVSFYYSYLL